MWATYGKCTVAADAAAYMALALTLDQAYPLVRGGPAGHGHGCGGVTG